MSATTRSGRWVRTELAADGIDLTGLAIDPAGTGPQRQPDGRRTVPGSTSTTAAGTGASPSTRPAPRRSSPAAGWRCSTCPIGRGTCCRSPGRPAPSSPATCRTSAIRTTSTCGTSSRAADVLFVSSAHHLNPAPMLKQLVRRSGGSMVVCGRGGLGVAVATTDGIRVYPPPRVDLPVVDTNGAGDALAVGFLVAHELEGRPLEEAVLRGQLAARWTCAQRAQQRRPGHPRAARGAGRRGRRSPAAGLTRPATGRVIVPKHPALRSGPPPARS